mgnify:CR=1 FL=1
MDDIIFSFPMSNICDPCSEKYITRSHAISKHSASKLCPD